MADFLQARRIFNGSGRSHKPTVTKSGISSGPMAGSSVSVWKSKQWIGRTVAAALLAVIICMLWRWFEHRNVYRPQAELEGTPADARLNFEEIHLGDKPRLHAWFLPGTGHAPRQDPAVLVCSGNGGNISHRITLAKALLGCGVNVFLFDYRGFGQSTGRPDEEGTYQDAQAAYAWLRQKGFSPNQIIAYGESLGGAIATELALREKVSALILQSTFTCMPDIGAEVFPWLPVRYICSIHYNTGSKLPRIKVPVLIIHSRGDKLIGFHHAEKNFATANEPKFLREVEGDHNDAVDAAPAKFTSAIADFLVTLPAPAAAK
jgi:uncharacterized protein